jgi:hypothetical protein
MSKSTRPSNVAIAKAAILRAAGFDWSYVAEELNRSAARVRHWPVEFPDLWKYYYLFAQLRFVLEAAQEAEQILRVMAEAPEGAGRRLAQRELARFRSLREQPDSPPAAEPAATPAADSPNAEPPDQPGSFQATCMDEFMNNLFGNYVNELLERERQLANRDPNGWTPIFIGFHYD